MKLPPITLEALHVLDAIERRGSFAKAAEELNKATSALSYTVQKLEEQLDLTLFQRQGRRSVLTPSGKLLLLEGRKILGATQHLSDQVRELATGWEPKLRIALESNSERKLFFDALSTLLDEHPKVEIDVKESVLNGGWEALEHDRIDLLVGAPSPLPPQKGMRSALIPPADMQLVAAASHPLSRMANDSKLVDKHLSEYLRIVIHDTAEQNVLRNEGLTLGNNVFYVQTMEQKLHAQLAGIGVGHLPRKLIQEHLDKGQLVILKTSTPTTENRERHIAWKITNKGKVLKRFVELILAQYSE